MPLVSVVMPVFNGEKYILESVNSILTQTFKDFEFVIINDGSTDRTGEIILSIRDDRIIYHKLEQNIGAAAATNAGHDIASRKYIAHMDADDIALPNRLEWQVSFLERFPQVDILGGWMEVFGAASYRCSVPASDGEIKTNLLFGADNINNPTAMFRNSFKKEKQLRCNPSTKAFDWEFWTQAMFKGACFANLQEIVLRYRGHENQQSRDLSRIRNDLSLVRLSVLELFYPDLTAQERVTVEPILQWVATPSLPRTQIEAGLDIIHKMLDYNKQSRVKENRQTLRERLKKIEHSARTALAAHRRSLIAPMNKANTSQPKPKSNPQSLITAAQKREKAFFAQGRYQEALDVCLQMGRAYPKISGVWNSAAVNCVKLGRWQEAIKYAQTALACGEKTFAPYDALAHSYGHLAQWDDARRTGLQALKMRDSRFGGAPLIPPPEPGALPPPPGAQTRERNIIAFSLFGGDSTYCEPAVLNVQEQPVIYPHWVCRFYVDDSVPASVISRLRAGGAQIVPVDGAAAQWPGPMWRLLALDDPQAHRILFRDADSVISRREAAAVDQWLASGKRFHMMRDWGSHTELMLAGLWDVVAGSLPPLDRLIAHFLSTPIESEHFADQYFLRQYVWPYARTSLMQHDSVFGFMDAVAFPAGERTPKFHVGCFDSSPVFAVKTDLPNGTETVWALYRIEQRGDGQPHEELICSYPGTVQDGTVKAHIPDRYARWIEQGAASVRLVRTCS